MFVLNSVWVPSCFVDPSRPTRPVPHTPPPNLRTPPPLPSRGPSARLAYSLAVYVVVSGGNVVWAPLLGCLQLHQEKRPRGSFATPLTGWVAPLQYGANVRSPGRAGRPFPDVAPSSSARIAQTFSSCKKMCRWKREETRPGRPASDTLKGRHRIPHVGPRIPNDRPIFTRSWPRWKLKGISPGSRFLPGYSISSCSLIGYAASPMTW